MKLRNILLTLSLLALMTTFAGGYLYFRFLESSAFDEASRQAALNAEVIRGHLTSFLSENLKAVRALSGLKEFEQALSSAKDQTALEKANHLLDHYNRSQEANVCYLMDSDGNTIASSNREEPDSFVGQNYGFRPYFQEAIQGRTYVYMALGVTSQKRGVYYSNPVYKAGRTDPLGVVVIKASVDAMEKEFDQGYEGIVALLDPRGLIFMSNRREWLYHLFWKPTEDVLTEIAESREFGDGPWKWIGMTRKGTNLLVDQSGIAYLLHSKNLPDYPGWKVVFLRNLESISKGISGPIIKTAAPVILGVSLLVGCTVFFLYRKASLDIKRRRLAEDELKGAREALDLYSRELEAKVEKRTLEIRRLSGKMMESQEKERRAIARELHDELGQMLTALRMEAVWLLNHISGKDSAAARRALTMCGLIDKTIDDVKDLAIRLRPGILDELGLVEALEWYTGEFEKRTQIACVLLGADIPPVGNDLATAVYRIAQEALTNVARHASAGHAEVLLRENGGVLSLSVKDDGRGFNTDQADILQGLGLGGMRERAALVGGELEIHSIPGEGTTVAFTVSFPLQEGGLP